MNSVNLGRKRRVKKVNKCDTEKDDEDIITLHAIFVCWLTKNNNKHQTGSHLQA